MPPVRIRGGGAPKGASLLQGWRTKIPTFATISGGFLRTTYVTR